MTPPLHHDPVSEADLRLVIARMEAKLDVALAQHGARLESHGRTLQDHEARLRAVEGNRGADPDDVLDHESRLRAVEARKTVSPGVLWATVASIITAAGVILSWLAPVIQ